VHLSEAGFPVAGDRLYGGVHKRMPAELAAVARLDRPFLHAARLGFSHPATGAPVTFDAPLAPDLADVVETLRRVVRHRVSTTTAAGWNHPADGTTDDEHEEDEREEEDE
jgi:hypothetical protein